MVRELLPGKEILSENCCHVSKPFLLFLHLGFVCHSLVNNS